MTTVTQERVTVGRTGSSSSTIALGSAGTSERLGRRVVANVPADQLYFWSPEWQRLERAASHDLATGGYRDFSSVAEAISWLLDDEG
jgi:hypothetical protein